MTPPALNFDLFAKPGFQLYPIDGFHLQPVAPPAVVSLDGNLFTPGFYLNWGNFQLTSPQLFSANYLKLFADPASGAAAAPAAAPEAKPVSLNEVFLDPDFMQQVGNSIYSLDLDWHNLPVNRGLNLDRFSENTPRGMRPSDTVIRVKSNTLARGHGEIRPIKGSAESLITRVVVDFDKNVKYKNEIGNLLNLEIDGFAAVDPPLMTFDRKFPHPKKTVLSMTGGNYDYENPLGTTQGLTTPFGEERPAPPGGHNYWMFRFSPLDKSLLAGLETAISGGAMQDVGLKAGLGALLLWAFLPTVGLYEDKHYDALKVPFNTFPRRFGDLLKLLSPMWGPNIRTLRESAPLINPNTEYIDLNGKRQAIPADPDKIDKINEGLVKAGKTPIGRSRGMIIDWIFTELARDPKRLFRTDQKDLPYLLLHTTFRKSTWKTALGSIEMLPTTDLNFQFRLSKTPSEKPNEARARYDMRVELKPLDLGAIDVTVGGLRIKAKSFRVKHATLDWNNVPGLAGGNISKEILPLLVNLEGIEAEGLEITNGSSGLNIKLEHAKIESLKIRDEKQPDTKSMKIEMKGLKGKGLVFGFPGGALNTAQADIPEITFVDTRDGQGNLRMRSLEVPSLSSKGSFSFGSEIKGKPIKVETDGSSMLKDIKFYETQEKGERRLLATAKFSGEVDSTKVTHPWIGGGVMELSTVEKTDKATTHHPLTGTFRFNQTIPDDKSKPAGAPEFHAQIDFPYLGLGTEGRFKMPMKSSAIRDGKFVVGPGTASLEGDIDINDAQLLGLSDDPSAIGNFLFAANFPTLDTVKIKGRGRFHFLSDGWRLGGVKDSGKPLNISLAIKDTELEHHPDLSTNFISKLPQSEVVKTKVKVTKAEVELSDVRQIEYRIGGEGDNKRGRITQVDTGPMTIHHIQGSGDIWVNLAIWGFLRGHFPQLGTTEGKAPKKPDPKPIVQHLPEEERKKLGTGDFVRLGGVNFSVSPDGSWKTHLDDLLLCLRETGGRKQFGLIRIPVFNAATTLLDPPAGSAKDKKPEAKYTFDFGAGDFLINAFLNDPQRGGSFRFYAWDKPGNP